MRICPSYAKGWYWISILFVKGINFYKWHSHSAHYSIYNKQRHNFNTNRVQPIIKFVGTTCIYDIWIWSSRWNVRQENIEYVPLDLFKCNEFINGLSFQAMLCTAVEQSSSATNFVRIYLMKSTDVDLNKLNETFGRMCAYQIFGSLRGISEIIFFAAGKSFWGARNISSRREQFLGGVEYFSDVTPRHRC